MAGGRTSAASAAKRQPFAARQRQALGAQLLSDFTRLLAGTSAQDKGDPPVRFARFDRAPQFGLSPKAAVVLRSDQPVSGLAQRIARCINAAMSPCRSAT